ncbi:rhodanese-like domain-containing protein [Pseudomonas sp. LRF_L74]|uniref:rhodanese-like domain-containing protein n=1 Tax=Pseudomonas sp. LRF_L74 TaxID=3369422 RepID=UPI003F5F0387
MRVALLLILCCLGSPVVASEAPLQVKGAMTINVMQARYLYEYGAMFVDVRSARQWSWGHVAGAVHLPIDDGFSDLAHQRWPRELPLVLYCESDVCPHAAQASQLAVAWGYTQVFYFRAGYFSWQLHDLPQGKGGKGDLLAFMGAL